MSARLPETNVYRSVRYSMLAKFIIDCFLQQDCELGQSRSPRNRDEENLRRNCFVRFGSALAAKHFN